MWLLRLQKITSGLLIFFLLFSFTLRVPFITYFSSQSYADQDEFYNLVSIIVDEDTYSKIKTKLVRYSRDIQGVLDNTRVVILPTPTDASVRDIASLNESLFFEGYKSVKDVNFESRLIGTVLVGKVPVPVVFDGDKSSRSILPFIDFEDKAYIYDEASGKYKKNKIANTQLNPEIWHGVISPNSGNDDEDIQAIKDYFDKNHDFYTGQGVFNQENGVIDGQTTPAPEDYEPYVFYYDQFRENKALQYQKYVGYQMYMQNIEDITYNRYSKELAEKVKNQVLGNQNKDIQDLLTKVDPNFDMSAFESGGIDVNASPDIITRYITNNSTKKFLEIFNGSSLGKMRKYVYNAGRYNKSGSKVNLDMPPFLISVLDQVSSEVIKNVNNSLEREITNLVKNGLSQKIAIPLVSNGTGKGEGGRCDTINRNFYFGKISNDITEAKDCSIYRGSTFSGTLVEANRGYNINLIQEDLALCQGDFRRGDTGAENISQGYWGGDTPLNFDVSADGGYGNFDLKNYNLKGGIRPVFDILGSKKIEDESKIPSPLDCLSQGTFITTYREKLETRGSGDNEREVCVLDFQAPVLGKSPAGSWSCRTNNIQSQSGISFIGELAKIANNNVGSCVIRTLELDTSVFKQERAEQSCRGSGDNETCSCPANQGTTEFKTIPSYILHTSPTNEDFGAQTKSLFTAALPIDTNRYIDFIGAKGGKEEAGYGYQRIDFPKLFRISPEAGETLSLELIDAKLKQHLDEVSANINTVIENADPSSLQGIEKEVYEALKTGDYPLADFDLYQILQDKPLEMLTVENQSKEISYYDTLVFALYWNNLTTVSSKYKFIFEDYLSNQFEGNDYKFNLPRSKKSYEIAYLSAPGDAQNMYIKLDPEMKGVHPYAQTLSQNLELQSVLLASSVATPYTTDGAFQCSPPDGVPIWEWVPAVICWLSNMLPPTIKISQGGCGDKTLFLNKDEKEELLVCEGDVNKNGVNDCIEGKLTTGSLSLTSDSGRYYYHSPGILEAKLLDSDGQQVKFDNTSYIQYDLQKVEIPLKDDEVFSSENKKIIYDKDSINFSGSGALKDSAKYVNFNSARLRSQQGKAKTYFYGKGFDANVYFTAQVQAKDPQGNIVIDLKSNTQKIQIRGDRLFIQTHVIKSQGEDIPDNTILASNQTNFFLLDEGQSSKQDAISQMLRESSSKERLLLSVNNNSLAGNTLDLNYPLSVELLREGESVLSLQNVTQEQLSRVYPLFTANVSGRYELQVTDATGFSTYRTLEVLADEAKTLEASISTSLIETGGNISTHLVTLLDQFGNPASGELYTIGMKLSGGGLVFESNGAEEASYNIVEGYKAFRLRSTDKQGNTKLSIQVKNIAGEIISESTRDFRTIDDIILKIEGQGENPKVGGGIYKYNVSFRDKDGAILTDLNSRVYLIVPKLYGRPLQAYTNVVNGLAELSLQTSTLAAKNISLEFQLEGGNEIYKKNIDILPELPIKIDLYLNKDKIEASEDVSAILQATLKDRYNNEVFTDLTTQLDIEIPSQSQQIISVDSSSKVVQDGKLQFVIQASDVPGIGYFKVNSTPDLGENSFDLIGQAPFEKGQLTVATMTQANGELSQTGKDYFKVFSDTKYISKFSTLARLKASTAFQELSSVIQEQLIEFWNKTNKLEVSGIGENAGSIETFFFWDKKSISNNAYNGIYSVLLGAPYGDISQENYLAGALLFDKNNNALAVSSLLNTPYKFSDSFSLEKNGNISSLVSGDITQDIQFTPDFDQEGRLIVDISNAALENYIGRIYYNTSENSDISLNIDESLGYSVALVGKDAVVKNASGKKIFIAYESGRFERKAGSYVEIDTQYIGDGIQLLLKNGTDRVGSIKILGNFNLNVTRDAGILDNKLSSLKDTLIVHLSSNQYSTREKYTETDDATLRFYYQDPFADRYALDEFNNSDITGIESSYNEAGIGWKDSNTILLSFSAGESVGSSTKNFQSFSLINLGDPVVSLKPLKYTFPRTAGEEKSFDPTVGKLIENQKNLIGYRVLDYNNDDAQDILTIQTDGYLKLFENIKAEGNFLEQRSLVYAADGGSSKLVTTGDFTGDGYDDIFFVSETGQAELFNNIKKDFSRFDISSQISLSGSIIQLQSFDMDSDGVDDIVTLDDAGEIHIFYGGGTSKNPVFTKNFVGDGYGIELSKTTMSHGGGIYYDNLTQINPDDASAILKSSQEYISDFQDSITAQEDAPMPEFIDESFVNNFLYLGLPYIPTNYQATNKTDQEVLVDGIGEELSPIGGSAEAENTQENTTTSLNTFLNDYGDYVTYSGLQNNYNVQTYFLRSQYADTQGLEITKTFTDDTPKYLQTGDRVYLDINIKNTSTTRKDNIAYVDSLPKFFNFASNTFEVLGETNEIFPIRPSVAEYNILVDGFYLDPGEETTIRFELVTLPLSYGYMQVGLYEQGEVGDDIYGDIVLKENNKNCGAEADIYRSTSMRAYTKGITVPSCDAAAVDVGNTFPELADTNKNGVPDYLEGLLQEDANGNLVPDTESASIETYRTKILEELGVDTDGDGIPNKDDTMIYTDSATDFMGALDAINGKIDEISEKVDTVIEGLSCGFGGGSCFASPLNWAPLAPGNDPTLFGMPVGNGLKVSEGVPIFSALTGIPSPFGCLPSVFPVSPLAFPSCVGKGAGGSLGVDSAGNFVRIFATPTVTGAAGIAVCFGGPARVAGNANPPGVSPIVPGGNCIVAAMPILGCEGGEGDPGELGYPIFDDFGLINANCEGGNKSSLVTPQKIEASFVQDYLEYLRTGIRPGGLYVKYKEAFKKISTNGGGGYLLPSEPLINIGGAGDSSMSMSVDIDTSALASGNFQDVIQIKNKRIAGFPGFLMDWVERQLDEITSKLTNLPKIFVILPDFGGIFDFSWKDFGYDMQDAFNTGKNESQNEREEKNAQLETLRSSKSSLDCTGADKLACSRIDLQIASISGKNNLGGTKETLSGIKEVFEFVGNIPLVNVEMETVNVNVPWIEPTELDRFAVDWNYTLEQWKSELADAQNSWSLGASCSGSEAEQARCKQENSIKEKAVLDAQALISSLSTNIQILQEYKQFPDKLAKLINIKEVWLDQILCNIQAIASLMGEWIGTNGERFKAWVELFVLIKAILKSWQLFIDVFTGYEEECQQCKNERQDLQNFIFKLISVIIPSPPIIQFPKWPDIILDLHNIRAGLTIYMPDFQMNLRPIILPTLPELHLPNLPDASFSLPALPTLPRFNIPELPDLPTLPTVELPDLPPPPKIPKLFGAVEGILNIIKLVTKIMCILKSSPFVPEWRAGDQIAFLTERNGYLPTDFIDIQPPAFSYSMVSAIKVSTYVNFEFETEFIIEAARSITAPIDAITNNIINMFNISLSDISLVEAIPEKVNVNLESDGGITVDDLSLAPLDKNPEGILFLASLIAKKSQELITYLAKYNSETLSNKEFLSYVGEQLSSDVITSNQRTKELQSLWEQVYNLTYSKEDAFISELKQNSKEKFQTVEDIISTEIEYSKKQQKRLQNLGSPELIRAVSVDLETSSRESGYNKLLEAYNISSLKSATKLVSGESEESKLYREDIEQKGQALMNRVRGGLNNYQKQGELLANSDTSPLGGGGATSTCNSSGTQYNYEGIYVLENGKNYRLFDYVDSLRGDEVPTIVDLDNDGDNDILYMVGGKLYFKENRTETSTPSHSSDLPFILKANDNPFYNGERYYESINGFTQLSVSDGAINIEFQKPTDSKINNFRMTYNTIVDRYMNKNSNFVPKKVETHIVDGISDIESKLLVQKEENYTLSKNLASLQYIGAMNGIKLTTEKLKNIKEELSQGTQVVLTPNTPIYAGESDFKIIYSLNDGTRQEIIVAAFSTLTVTTTATIDSLSGDAYISMGILEDIKGTDIIDYIGMPLLPGAKISYSGNKDILDESSHVDIRYYDGSLIQMDYRDISSYTLYDLGDSYRDSYTIRLEIENDFYYARIQAFKNNILGTLSKQILLSPQRYSDTLAPQIGLHQRIRIPVYQSQLVDLTPYIYEDGGFSGIDEVRIDTNLSIDSDGDGNTKNDAETEKINITKTLSRIAVEFGPYDTLFEKNIVIALVDDNGNIGSKELTLEVYSPDPQIDAIQENVISGQIDETLLEEPIRLYRYRGGVVAKLQKSDGGDIVETDEDGNYDFQTKDSTKGLNLVYSGSTVAYIDEYTGRIDIEAPLISVRVLASNNLENTSVYPEIQVISAGGPIFRQFVKIPMQETQLRTSFENVEELGAYMKILDQEQYGSFRVPLGAPYNPGSLSIYLSSDVDKKAVMTIFQDGRIHIDRSQYRLVYRTLGENLSLVLVDANTGLDIAQILYRLDASYILR